MQLLLLQPGQLLLGGIVSALLWRSLRIVIVVKRFLSMSLPDCIDLFHQLLGIVYPQNQQ